MQFLVALVYLLLCVRLRVQIDVCITGMKGSVFFCVGVFGLSVRHETVIVQGERHRIPA